MRLYVKLRDEDDAQGTLKNASLRENMILVQNSSDPSDLGNCSERSQSEIGQYGSVEQDFSSPIMCSAGCISNIFGRGESF